jgi:hypothetical protein
MWAFSMAKPKEVPNICAPSYDVGVVSNKILRDLALELCITTI